MFTSNGMNSGTQSAKPGILLLGSRMESGGPQRSLLDQARWFYQNNHRVVLAFLYDAESLYGRWQPKVPMPLGNLKTRRPDGSRLANAGRGLRGAVRIAQMVAIGEFDAVLACGAEAVLTGLPVAWLGKVRTRIAVYTGRPKQTRRYVKTVNKLAKCLVVDSQRAGEEAVELGVRPEKIVRIPPGITPAEETNPHPFRTRWDLDFSEDCPLVMVSGRMDYRSAYPSLLRALPRVHARVPSAGFALLGEGSLRPGLIEEARKTGINEYVRFPGRTVREDQLLAAADIYLALPGTQVATYHLLKVLSLGKPVIAVDADGAGEVIEPGVNGLLAPPDDEEALAGALVMLLEDGALRARLAAEGRSCVQRDYTLDRMCAAYAALLDPAYELQGAA